MAVLTLFVSDEGTKADFKKENPITYTDYYEAIIADVFEVDGADSLKKEAKSAPQLAFVYMLLSKTGGEPISYTETVTWTAAKGSKLIRIFNATIAYHSPKNPTHKIITAENFAKIVRFDTDNFIGKHLSLKFHANKNGNPSILSYEARGIDKWTQGVDFSSVCAAEWALKKRINLDEVMDDVEVDEFLSDFSTDTPTTVENKPETKPAPTQKPKATTTPVVEDKKPAKEDLDDVDGVIIDDDVDMLATDDDTDGGCDIDELMDQ